MYRLILVAILLSTSATYAGNDTRSSNYSFVELLFSPSAKSSGMGEGGVAQVHEKSFYFNPGSLGLFALKNKVSISSFVKDAKYLADITFYNSSFSIPLQNSNKDTRFLFAVGGYYSVTKLGTYQETTESFPDGTGQYYTPTLKNYNATFSAGYNSRVQFGVGVTIKKVKESIFDISTDGFAFDFGFISRYPIMPSNTHIYFTPTLGVSFCNLGSEIEIGGIGFDESIDTRSVLSISNSVHLPKRKNVGFSFEFGKKAIQNDEEKYTIISVLPTYELSQVMENDWYPIYGLELGLLEIFTYRTGKNKNLSWDNNTTSGYSLNTNGFFKLIQNQKSTKDNRNGLNRLFTDIISLEYSFSNYVIMKSYHEILLTIEI